MSEEQTESEEQTGIYYEDYDYEVCPLCGYIMLWDIWYEEWVCLDCGYAWTWR